MSDLHYDKVENICELIETELLLVGCSAIEDKLQVNGVVINVVPNKLT